MTWFRRHAEVLRRAKAALPNDKFRGCTQREIARLEKKLGLRLPKSYRVFLEVMGKHTGDFMSDLLVHYDDVPRLNEGARRVLKLSGSKLTLPSNALVWLARRQGEQFLFFKTGGEDPPVYYYYEGNPRFVLKFRSVWNAIESEVQMEEAINRRGGRL